MTEILSSDGERKGLYGCLHTCLFYVITSTSPWRIYIAMHLLQMRPRRWTSSRLQRSITGITTWLSGQQLPVLVPTTRFIYVLLTGVLPLRKPVKIKTASLALTLQNTARVLKFPCKLLFSGKKQYNGLLYIDLS